MLRSKWQMVAVAWTVLALFGAACSDASGATTSQSAVSSADDVIFGSGEIPDTFPAGFPLPAGSSIGSTMVVMSTGFTEIVVRINGGLEVNAEYFDQSLVAAGFSVDDSGGDGSSWTIGFNDDGAKGSIEITEPTTGISQAVVRYNLP